MFGMSLCGVLLLVYVVSAWLVHSDVQNDNTSPSSRVPLFSKEIKDMRTYAHLRFFAYVFVDGVLNLCTPIHSLFEAVAHGAPGSDFEFGHFLSVRCYYFRLIFMVGIVMCVHSFALLSSHCCANGFGVFGGCADTCQDLLLLTCCFVAGIHMGLHVWYEFVWRVVVSVCGVCLACA